MGVHNIKDLPEFRSSVLEAAPDKVILVDFFATWCGPCKAIAPTIAQWSEEYADKLICYKVDVDEANDIAAEYGIRAMPTFKVFKGGEEVKEIVGANPPLIQTTITSLF